MTLHAQITAVLAAHFVMPHKLPGGYGGPTHEWRCECGQKFGFSDTAISHQADAMAEMLTGVGAA